jgi:hypothetical protein
MAEPIGLSFGSGAGSRAGSRGLLVVLAALGEGVEDLQELA